MAPDTNLQIILLSHRSLMVSLLWPELCLKSHKQKLWENMVHIFSRIHPILDVDLLILILDSSHGGVSTLSPSSLAFLLAIIPSFMRFWRQTVYFMLADLGPDCREHSACAEFPHCTKKQRGI